MTVESTKYKLSFTAASMKLNETIKIAQYAVENEIKDLATIRDKDVVFSSSKMNTTVREFREIKKRLELLTQTQLKLLTDGDFITQKQIGFLGICKLYQFIRDFTVEVTREKSLTFDYQLIEGDFNSFINQKQDLHPELEAFSPSTLKKAKQVMYLILAQAGIIDDSQAKNIQPQLVEKELIDAVIEDEPEYLKIYLLPDLDIKQAMQ
jgi:hypothetical protein